LILCATWQESKYVRLLATHSVDCKARQRGAAATLHAEGSLVAEARMAGRRLAMARVGAERISAQHRAHMA
jgi:hypothetical protein